MTFFVGRYGKNTTLEGKMSEFSLLKERKEGWAYPYRSKKAHYFVNGVSLCGKYRYSVDSHLMRNLLPASAFFDKELCQICLKKYRERY
jgi:hypothetical protein